MSRPHAACTKLHTLLAIWGHGPAAFSHLATVLLQYHGWHVDVLLCGNCWLQQTQLVQREEALTSTTNELEVKDQLIRELETAAALIQSELQEKAAVASAAAITIAGLQQQLVAAQEQAVDAVQQLQKQQHTATVALEEARTRAAEAEKERRTAAAQLRAAHSERALLRDKVESEQELLNVFSNQTEMVRPSRLC
jgi:chromosome segregation ATPase